MWNQIHIDIDVTKLGATAFIISFLRPRCDAHLIHQPTADNMLLSHSERILLLLFLSILRCYDKEYKKQKTSEIACEETKIWYKFP